MRVSALLTTTLREAPRDCESSSQELLVRGGYIRQLTAGIYSFLPLGQRVMRKITQIVREEMDRAGGQEVSMPILQAREIWEMRPAGDGPSRAEKLGAVLFRLKDRRGRDMALSPTHEEIVTLLAAEFVRSYRDLPRLVYQVQTKLRDEQRPRGGLLRQREFLMKDLYSFDAGEHGLDISYRKMAQAYHTIFTRCGLRFIAVEADSGAIGGKESQEFLAITGAGEDDAMLCDTCGYAANREKAEFVRTALPDEEETALEEVYTPGRESISAVAAFLDMPVTKTMKSVCYAAGDRVVMAMVRGDLEINEVKLVNTLYRAGINAADLRLAAPQELAEAGIVAGYTSPVGKVERVFIVADLSLRQGSNFVAGANRAHYHLKHVNYPRDYRVDEWEDIASAYDGAACARCGGKGALRAVRGCEIGHIFKPGTMYSDLFGATYLDAEGVARPLHMGSYGIGIGRVMATAVEQNHDEKGIIWPFSIAPYHVALVGLDLEREEHRQAAEQLYAGLSAAGIEVLYDDRPESAGVKFNDADLLGLPLRVVVSRRSLKNGGVEVMRRASKESRIVPLEEAVESIREEIQDQLHRYKS
jgi:prolyl-tRNA synthetase